MIVWIRAFLAALACAIYPTAAGQADETQSSIQAVVARAVQPMMAKYHIPGAAVAVTVDGRDYVFDYGLASKQSHQPVTHDTLFEIGSVTKTFTATLASLAQVDGRFFLSDNVAKHMPVFRGTPFGNVTLLNLGTHTPGGLPLQVPNGVTNDAELIQYLVRWQPAYAAGTYRTYGNVGIGMLGMIAAKSMNRDFTALIQGQLLPALGMKSTFINIPPARMADYAQGYTSDGAPIRMSAGVLWAQTYGVRTTATDLLRFLKANMNLIAIPGALQQAITQTHTGYFKAGPMTQDLVWEQYPYPVALKDLLEGNSPSMILKPTPVSALKPPQEPADDVWINKTGSTNGFSAYVAFVPKKRLGIVILANKSYPIEDRVSTAYEILTSLAKV
jgi:beta-lactamase class C